MEQLKYFPIEPLKENRFLINLQGTDVPSHLFRKYKIFNEGEELIFTTQFYETVQYSFNPKDFFNITGVSIEYLDPVGEVVNALDFQVKGSNFERNQSYKNDKLQINKLKLIVDKDTIKLRFKPKTKDGQQGNG